MATMLLPAAASLISYPVKNDGRNQPIRGPRSVSYTKTQTATDSAIPNLRALIQIVYGIDTYVEERTNSPCRVAMRGTA